MEAFFNGTFEAAGFTPQRHLRSRRSEYQTKNFTYEVSFKQALLYSFFNSGFYLPLSAMGVFVLAASLFSDSISTRLAFTISIIFLIPFYLYILILVLNRYRYVKGKVLVISKGNPVFLYGSKGQLIQYGKQDLVRIVSIIKKTATDSFVEQSLEVLKLYFKNGDVLVIPQLLLMGDSLVLKFPDTPVHPENKTIYLRKNHFVHDSSHPI